MRNPKWWGPQRLQRESAVANFWTNPLNWYLKDSPFRSFFGSNCWTVGCLWVLKGSAVHYHLLVMTVLKIFEATHNTSKCRKMPVSLQRFQHDWHGPALANCPFLQDLLWRTLSWHHSSWYDFPQVMCLWLIRFTDGLCAMPWCSPLHEVHIRRLWIAKFALRGRPDFQFFFHLFLCASSAETWSLCTIAAYCSIPMTLLRHSTTRPGMKPHRWWWS